LPFALCILAAWAWFRPGLFPLPGFAKADSTPRLRFSVVKNLEGYTFVPDPLSPKVLEALGNPDAINGTFVPIASIPSVSSTRTSSSDPAASDHRPVTGNQEPRTRNQEPITKNPEPRTVGTPMRVFFATWSPDQGRDLSVIQHTPDICWVGAGWKPIDAGLAKQLAIPLATRPLRSATADRLRANAGRPPTANDGPLTAVHRPPAATSPLPVPGPGPGSDLPSPISHLPFELRVFQSPDRTHRELVAWCTLIDGAPVPEGSRWAAGPAPGATRFERQQAAASAGRGRGAGLFGDALLHRRPSSGHKQFVRLSMPLHADAGQLLEQLAAFSAVWVKAAELSLSHVKAG
jgi:hypothetical protein